MSGTNHGGRDLWVVKLTGTGGIQWQSSSAATTGSSAVLSRQTADGGYILLGSDSSQSGDVSGANHGESDLWLVKLASTGTIQWEELLGGIGSYNSDYEDPAERRRRVRLLGHSYSSASGDVTGTNHGRFRLSGW